MPEPTGILLSLAFGAAHPKGKTPIELLDDKKDGKTESKTKKKVI